MASAWSRRYLLKRSAVIVSVWFDILQATLLLILFSVLSLASSWSRRYLPKRSAVIVSVWFDILRATLLLIIAVKIIPTP